MQIGAVFPQTEIGADVGAVRAYAERVQELGFAHILAYDHVVGADPTVHSPWRGPYDISTTFHGPRAGARVPPPPPLRPRGGARPARPQPRGGPLRHPPPLPRADGPVRLPRRRQDAGTGHRCDHPPAAPDGAGGEAGGRGGP